VRTIDDMRGLRIRVQQSENSIGMMRLLGAQPVELPYGQVLTGLTTRLIDGAENNWPSYVTTEHHTAAHFYTLTEHTMGPEVVVMSSRAWHSLSGEEQRIFREAARESSKFMRKQWQDWEISSRQQAQKAGTVIIADIDKQPFADAVSGVYDRALQEPKLRQLAERIRQAQ
jgi:TRAP-type C4-dicarboxylate transport system substrate-binding protein